MLNKLIVIGCPFCSIEVSDIVFENATAIAKLDGYPVSYGHTLIIPKRHIKDCFKLNQTELLDCWELINKCQLELLQVDKSIDGFNVGFNCGASAGQTVPHCHIHLIPRRKGDTPKPKGGVRGVIPDRMAY